MKAIQYVALLILSLAYHSVYSNSQSPSWNANQRKLNILILTFPGSGHTAIPIALGEELVKRGHQVTLSNSENKVRAAAERVGVKYINSGPMPEELFKKIEDFHTNGGLSLTLQMVSGFREAVRIETDQFISLVQEELQSGTKWDVVLSSDFLESFLPCLGEMLKIPALSLRTTLQNFPQTFPPWPWASPMVEGNTDDITFTQRLGNAIERVLVPRLMSYMFNSPIKDKVDTYCPALANVNLVFASSILLPDIVPSVIGIEYARTLSSLTHYVGPILTSNPEPCKGELEMWLNSKGENSVIFISMGSITNMKEERARPLVEGILRTNYSVIWAMRKFEEFKLDTGIDSERFYITDWLPQLAVLRHKAVGLAIVHGGANGLHECLDSGVPLIVLPGHTEQIGNAGRVHHHRLGIHLNRDGLTAEQVYQSILEIDSGDYRQNVAKIQKVFRQAGGVKRAADLVEFYSEVGYDHLIPAYAKYQWGWVQYYNVDVYSLLLLLALITVYVDYRILKCICSRCCCSDRKQKTD